MTISAATRVFALLGDPVSHSLSPAMQNAALRAAGIDGLYVTLRCASEHVGPLVHALASAGGGGNVTIPHKAEAALALQRRLPAVEATGVCNTFWLEQGRVTGDNTDVEGFRHAAHALVGDLQGAEVLVIGAGGAASAVVHALATAAASRVALLNRTSAHAAALAARFAVPSVQVITAAQVSGASFDLVVNATSLGLQASDDAPLDLDQPARVGAVLDLVCASPPTPLLAHAARLGIVHGDGREMLVQQGAAAFARWFGIAAPVAVMRNAIGAIPAGSRA